jgi:hypothetical protein
MRAQKFDFLFLAYLNTPRLCMRQLTLVLLKSDISLNFNKLLFKVTSFECHAHFLHSSRKKVEIPRILGLGDISFFDVERNAGL